MKKQFLFYKLISIIIIILFGGCSKSTSTTPQTEKDHAEEGLHISQQKMKQLGFRVGKIAKKKIPNYIVTYGQLSVPPQNRATVTPVIGANVQSILVVEGQKVTKGQILAYLFHPDLLQMQIDYTKAFHQLKVLEQDYLRQKKLYAEKVTSGKRYQEAERSYLAQKALVEGSALQLQQIGISIQDLQKGKFMDKIPIYSPISGYIEKISVRVGQYVTQSQELFDIINNHHVHVDLRVFEEDAGKVHIGQKVFFTTKANPHKQYAARIYTIGKILEDNPKAVHVHAEIKEAENTQALLPGMYVQGKILIDQKETLALPNDAIVDDGNQKIAFTVKKHQNEWEITPVEINVGNSSENWTEIILKNKAQENLLWIQNNAYYLISEMQKGSMKHEH